MKKFIRPQAFILIFLLCFPLFAKERTAEEQDLEVNTVLEDLGGELLWDSFFQSGVILIGDKQAGQKLSFYVGGKGETGPVLLDDRTVLQIALPYLENGKLFFPREFVSALKENIIPVSTMPVLTVHKNKQNEGHQFNIAAIVVDPGHGGKDPGAIGQHIIDGKKVTIQEKDVTLKVSKLLYQLLKKGFPDKKVLITRTGDTYPTLEERVNKANSVNLKNNEAIIYISIHANYNFNKHARGFEVWYLDPEHKRQVLDSKSVDSPEEIFGILNEMMEEEFNRESILIAGSIAKRFSEAFGKSLPSRGLKAEEWFVVRKARMPSVLVELGFVSNEQDAKMFLDDKQLQKFADALYLGIADFIESFENSSGFIAAGE